MAIRQIMGRNTCLSLILFVFFFTLSGSVQAQDAGLSGVPQNRLCEPDMRVKQLEAFLRFYNSPLAPYAQNFITSADKYQVDWKLVPAITGIESTFGKQIPYKSYNAYGWCNGAYQFQSWEQSIDYVTRFLAEKYISRGLDNPYKIAPVYAPPSKTWAGKVDFFMKKISCFDSQTCLPTLGLTL